MRTSRVVITFQLPDGVENKDFDAMIEGGAVDKLVAEVLFGLDLEQKAVGASFYTEHKQEEN
jgi:hypothetical protein